MALADEMLICLRLTQKSLPSTAMYSAAGGNAIASRASNSAACLGELPGCLERRAIDRKLSLGAKQPFTLADLFFQF
jgi:hypothetical protein